MPDPSAAPSRRRLEAIRLRLLAGRPSVPWWDARYRHAERLRCHLEAVRRPLALRPAGASS